MCNETAVYQALDTLRDQEAIQAGAELLRQGKLVIFPTETVYGIGANALDAAAVSGIYEAKGRPADNPLIVHVTTVADIAPLVTDFPERAQKLAEAFWPGPLTMILPRAEAVPALVSAGLPTVAVRIPSHPIARALIMAAGVPVAAPSANRSGRPSPTSAQHCIFDMQGRVDAILDGGSCSVGVESTVITLTASPPRILRPGGITREQIESVIGPVDMDEAAFREAAEGEAVASPGMKYRHYAPRARVALVRGSLPEFLAFCRSRQTENTWMMLFAEDEPEAAATGIPAVSYGSREHPEEQANRLFAVLRELDDKGAQQIYVRPPEPSGVGLAVYNRLLRAASFTQYDLEGASGCGLY